MQAPEGLVITIDCVGKCAGPIEKTGRRWISRYCLVGAPAAEPDERISNQLKVRRLKILNRDEPRVPKRAHDLLEVAQLAVAHGGASRTRERLRSWTGRVRRAVRQEE